jgi:hypothetical protein
MINSKYIVLTVVLVLSVRLISCKHVQENKNDTFYKNDILYKSEIIENIIIQKNIQDNLGSFILAETLKDSINRDPLNLHLNSKVTGLTVVINEIIDQYIIKVDRDELLDTNDLEFININIKQLNEQFKLIDLKSKLNKLVLIKNIDLDLINSIGIVGLLQLKSSILAKSNLATSAQLQKMKKIEVYEGNGAIGNGAPESYRDGT